jgi:hypothetical protein
MRCRNDKIRRDPSSARQGAILIGSLSRLTGMTPFGIFGLREKHQFAGVAMA